MKKKIRKIIEDLGWSIVETGDSGAEIYKHSPLGEDFYFYVSDVKDIVNEVVEYAESFDADEHAEIWIENRGKNGVPNSIRDLLQDADDIKEMLQELSDNLESVK